MGHTLIASGEDIFSNQSPTTLSHTVTSGSTLLVLSLIANAQRTGGAPTYNGDAMTDSGEGQVLVPSEGHYIEIWYLIDPDSGAHDFSVPNTGTATFRAFWDEWEAGTGSEFNVAASIGSDGADASVSITPTADGSLIFAAMMNGRFTNDQTADYTEIVSTDYGGFVGLSQYLDQTTAAAVDMGWTSVSDNYAIIAVAFEDVSAGGTDSLTGSDLTGGTPTLDSPTIGQVHALTGSDLTSSAPTLDSPTIEQVHALTGTELTGGTPTLDTPTLAEGTDNLTGADLTGGTPTLDSPTIGQTHALTGVGILGGVSIDSPALGQIHGLTGADLTGGVPTFGSPSLSDFLYLFYEEFSATSALTTEYAASSEMTTEYAAISAMN